MPPPVAAEDFALSVWLGLGLGLGLGLRLRLRLRFGFGFGLGFGLGLGLGLGVRVALGLAVGFGLRAAHLREAAAAEAVLAASLVGDRHGGLRLGIVGRILGKRLRQG